MLTAQIQKETPNTPVYSANWILFRLYVCVCPAKSQGKFISPNVCKYSNAVQRNGKTINEKYLMFPEQKFLLTK